MKRRRRLYDGNRNVIVDAVCSLWDALVEAFQIVCECAAIVLPLVAVIYLLCAITGSLK